MTAAVTSVTAIKKNTPEYREAIKNAAMDIFLRYADKPISKNSLKKIFDFKAEAAARWNYDKRLLYSRGLDGLNVIDKENRKDKNDMAPSSRAIYRALEDLVEEGKINHRNGEYSLSDEAKSDIRYFANRFGDALLNILMMDYYPAKNSLQYNIDRLVQIFGTLTLLCFITTASRGMNTIKHSSGYEERLVSSCLDTIVPIKKMYDYFLAIVDYCIDVDDNDSKIKNDIKSLLKSLTPSDRKMVREVFESAHGSGSEQEKMENNSFLTGELNILRTLGQERIEQTDRTRNLPNQDSLKNFRDAFDKAYPLLKQMYDSGVFSGFEDPKQRFDDVISDRNVWHFLYDKNF